MLGITIYRERYERWWLGKYCRPAFSEQPFKKVVKIDMIGPPSFVYGQITFHYEDGTEAIVVGGSTGKSRRCSRAIQEAYKPRKIDVEIQDRHSSQNGEKGGFNEHTHSQMLKVRVLLDYP